MNKKKGIIFTVTIFIFIILYVTAKSIFEQSLIENQNSSDYEEQEYVNENLKEENCRPKEDVTNMNNYDFSYCNLRLDLEHNNITKIENLEAAQKVKYIYLYANDIVTIENIETIPSEKFRDEGELWVDESIEYITQESYDFLKENENIKLFFVPEGSEAGSGYLGSDKTIDNLEII